MNLVNIQDVANDIKIRKSQIEVIRESNKKVSKYVNQAKRLLALQCQGKKINLGTGSFDIVGEPGVKYSQRENGILIDDFRTGLSVCAMQVENGMVVGHYEQKQRLLVRVEDLYILLKGQTGVLNLEAMDSDGKKLEGGDIGIETEECSFIEVTDSRLKANEFVKRARRQGNASSGVLDIALKRSRVPFYEKKYSLAICIPDVLYIRCKNEGDEKNSSNINSVLNTYVNNQLEDAYLHSSESLVGQVLIKHVLEELTFKGTRVFERLANRQ